MKVLESKKSAGRIFIPKCPGCGVLHALPTIEGTTIWGFNGDLEKPTFTPSLLSRTGKYVPSLGAESYEWYNKPENASLSTVCHSFIRDGKMEFLSDCTHALAGQTVELPEIDENSKFYVAWVDGCY